VTVAGAGPSASEVPAAEVDLEFRPRRRDAVALTVTPRGALGWVSQDRAPIVLDRATQLLLELFDGQSSLDEIVADIEAELGPTQHDIAEGALTAARRLAAEGFLVGVRPDPARRGASILFRQLTDGIAHESAHAAEHGGRVAEMPWDTDPDLLTQSGPAQLGSPDVFSLDFPASPVRVYTTVPRVREAVEAVATHRLGGTDGALLWAAVDGGASQVGRPLFTLFGTNRTRLVVTADQDTLVVRTLRHLSLPLWLAEQPGLWWTGLRTLVSEDGAVLVSPGRLGVQPGLLRAIERAGYRVVDSVLSAIDPDTHEVLVHQSRFDPTRGELSAVEAGGPERFALVGLALGVFEYAFLHDAGVDFFAKALAVAIEPGPHIDRQRLLDAAVTLAMNARRVVLAGQDVRQVVSALGRRS